MMRTVKDMQQAVLGRTAHRYTFEVVPEAVDGLPDGIYAVSVMWEKGSKVCYTDPAPVDPVRRRATFHEVMKQNATLYREGQAFLPKEYKFKLQAQTSPGMSAAAMNSGRRKTVGHGVVDLSQYVGHGAHPESQRVEVRMGAGCVLRLAVRAVWLQHLAAATSARSAPLTDASSYQSDNCVSDEQQCGAGVDGAGPGEAWRGGGRRVSTDGCCSEPSRAVDADAGGGGDYHSSTAFMDILLGLQSGDSGRPRATAAAGGTHDHAAAGTHDHAAAGTQNTPAAHVAAPGAGKPHAAPAAQKSFHAHSIMVSEDEDSPGTRSQTDAARQRALQPPRRAEYVAQPTAPVPSSSAGVAPPTRQHNPARASPTPSPVNVGASMLPPPGALVRPAGPRAQPDGTGSGGYFSFGVPRFRNSATAAVAAALSGAVASTPQSADDSVSEASTHATAVASGANPAELQNLSGALPQWMWPTSRGAVSGVPADALVGSIASATDVASLQRLARGLLVERNEYRQQAAQWESRVRELEEEARDLRDSRTGLAERIRALETQVCQLREDTLVDRLVEAKLNAAQRDLEATELRGQLLHERERSRQAAAQLAALHERFEILARERAALAPPPSDLSQSDKLPPAPKPRRWSDGNGILRHRDHHNNSPLEVATPTGIGARVASLFWNGGQSRHSCSSSTAS